MRGAPPLAAAFLVLVAWVAPAAAAIDGVRVATLTVADDEPAREPALLPRGLGSADLARYRQIFASVRQADWREAARLTDEVEDKVLLGHVLAERYLSPRSPRIGFVELAAWLERFADLPQATRIHKLALARKPAADSPPRKPESAGETDAAAAWQDDLAAWRRGDAAVAADRFTRLAHDLGGEETARARAAFWAARANLRARRPHLMVPMLQLAAQGSDAFHGPLAQRMLDDGVVFNRAERRAAGGVIELLVRYPAARRILALVAVGERELADAELRRLSARAPSDLVHDLAAVARTLALPSAQASAAGPAGRPGAGGEPPLLPPPEWQPADGYQIDPSLLHAVIRAESGFDPAARSPRGALGPMQVMPETARHLARRTEVAYAGDAWLLEPSNNTAIGQGWLRQLAGTPTVQGSLIHLLAAFNAGEGRVQAWLTGELAPTAGDPLLFVESVPLAETRSYLKKVLANLWAYQARAGRDVPSLRSLAENRWPELEPTPNPVPRPKFRARAKPRQVHARAD